LRYFAELARFQGPLRKNGRYVLGAKFSLKNLVFSSISLTATFAGNHPIEGVKAKRLPALAKI